MRNEDKIHGACNMHGEEKECIKCFNGKARMKDCSRKT
jgi:hypothetical protein